VYAVNSAEQTYLRTKAYDVRHRLSAWLSVRTPVESHDHWVALIQDIVESKEAILMLLVKWLEKEIIDRKHLELVKEVKNMNCPKSLLHFGR